jgi:hypothetical protein
LESARSGRILLAVICEHVINSIKGVGFLNYLRAIIFSRKTAVRPLWLPSLLLDINISVSGKNICRKCRWLLITTCCSYSLNLSSDAYILVLWLLLAYVSLITRTLMEQIKLSDPALQEISGHIHSNDWIKVSDNWRSVGFAILINVIYVKCVMNDAVCWVNLVSLLVYVVKGCFLLLWNTTNSDIEYLVQ